VRTIYPTLYSWSEIQDLYDLPGAVRNLQPNIAPTDPVDVVTPAAGSATELAEAGDSGRHSELAAKYALPYSSDWVAELASGIT